MFSQPISTIAALISVTLVSTTVGLISFLPTVGLAQNSDLEIRQRLWIRQSQACDQLVQRLELRITQQGRAAGICQRFQGRLTIASLAALRGILNTTQLETFDQKVRDTQELVNIDTDCTESIPRPNSLKELKCR